MGKEKKKKRKPEDDLHRYIHISAHVQLCKTEKGFERERSTKGFEIGKAA